MTYYNEESIQEVSPNFNCCPVVYPISFCSHFPSFPLTNVRPLALSLSSRKTPFRFEMALSVFWQCSELEEGQSRYQQRIQEGGTATIEGRNDRRFERGTAGTTLRKEGERRGKKEQDSLRSRCTCSLLRTCCQSSRSSRRSCPS